MSKKNKKQAQPEPETVQPQAADAQAQQPDAPQPDAPQPDAEPDDKPAEPAPDEIIAQLQAQLDNQKNEYLLLMAEFDNFRRRTLKERQELIKNASERAMKDLLPVVDDFERALDAISSGGDLDSLKEGVALIHNKFIAYLAAQGVKPIESTGADFDPELHDAITMFPAPDESMRGKVVDTTTRGYTINDKVLRHAKVVVGQ